MKPVYLCKALMVADSYLNTLVHSFYTELHGVFWKWIVLRESHRGVSLGIVCNSFKCKERKGFAKDAMKVVEFEIFLKILVLFIY